MYYKHTVKIFVPTEFNLIFINKQGPIQYKIWKNEFHLQLTLV